MDIPVLHMLVGSKCNIVRADFINICNLRRHEAAVLSFFQPVHNNEGVEYIQDQLHIRGGHFFKNEPKEITITYSDLYEELVEQYEIPTIKKAIKGLAERGFISIIQKPNIGKPGIYSVNYLLVNSMLSKNYAREDLCIQI